MRADPALLMGASGAFGSCENVQASPFRQVPLPGTRRRFSNVKRFRGGLVFKAHRWLYHSTLGSRVIKKKEKKRQLSPLRRVPFSGTVQGSGFRVRGSGFRVQVSGFGVRGSGLRVQGSGFRVQGSGFRVRDLTFRVQGSEFGVQGLEFGGWDYGLRV